MSEITIRPGTPDDTYTSFLLFEESFADLWRRLGNDEPTSFGDELALAQMWQERCPLYEHIVSTAESFWLAERDGEALGFARSVRRGDLRELTEFFVRPGAQSSGAGKALLAQTFAPAPNVRRFVIASPEVRAQALYIRSGVYPVDVLYYLYRTPKARDLDSTLEALPLDGTESSLASLDAIDRSVLGISRLQDHLYLLSDRAAFLYRRNGRPVGYGYTGKRNGPFAFHDPADIPAALAHAESVAAAAGLPHFGLEVPGRNRSALEALLAHGFHIEPFVATLLTDGNPPQFDRYIATSPPFLL